jgi:pimeloyl-ACP methyl ester carboxylesterase
VRQADSGAPEDVAHRDASHNRDRTPVVFVHGLWMRGLTFRLQARRIEHCGFRTDCSFSYASVTGILAIHARRLAAHLSRLDGQCVHLVGHSMGTLVILKMLAEYRDPRIGRIVFLGPPFEGSRVGRAVGTVRPGRWMLGRSFALWSQEETVPPPHDAEVGVIAGTMPLGGGALFGVLEKPHDGVVTVKETRIPGIRDHICLHVSHFGMLVAPVVAEQICAFLQHGHFLRPAGLAEGA